MSRVLVYPHTDQRSDVSRQWSKYGIATLQFNNTKLKAWAQQATEEYLQKWVVARSDHASYVAEPEGMHETVGSNVSGECVEEAPRPPLSSVACAGYWSLSG